MCGIYCRARKPFHPQKLYDFAVKNFFLQETELYEPDTQEEDHGQQVSSIMYFPPALAHLVVCITLIRVREADLHVFPSTMFRRNEG